MTDEVLYRRYLSGDEDALGALMERYGTKLTLYLDGYLCDLHEAEDLMIEAFAYLIAKRPAIRDGGFRAYLYQSARHMALRLLHKKRARNCFSLDALTEEPEARELVEETVQSAERARLLRTCMAELHEDYREALFLVYFEGLSHAETAAVMGKREKQVADLIYRGKIALRKRLEQEGVAFIIKCERANKLRRTYFFTQKRRRGYEIRVLKARGAADYRGNVRKGRKAGRDCRACRQVPSDHIPRARARQDRGNGLPLSSRV